METINNFVMFMTHLIFIGMSYQLLITLFDWSKFIYNRPENVGKLRLFLFLVAIAIGYLVSHFMIELIQLSQSLFVAFR